MKKSSTDFKNTSDTTPPDLGFTRLKTDINGNLIYIDDQGNVYQVGTGSNQAEYGGIKVEGNIAATAIAVVDTWYQFTNFDTDMPDNGGIVSDQSNDKIDITDAGDYIINLSASVGPLAGIDGDTLSLGVSEDGGLSMLFSATVVPSGGDRVDVIVGGEIAALKASAQLTLWVKNETDITDIPLVDARMSVMKVSAPAAGSAVPYPGLSPDRLFHAQDRKLSGLHGGDALVGMNQRDLTTVVRNTITGASLGVNEFTLPAGRYYAELSAPALQTAQHRIFLYNITAGAIQLIGTSARSSTDNLDSTKACINEYFEITVPTTFRIDHYVANQNLTEGLGQAAGVGEDEVYTDARLWKIEGNIGPVAETDYYVDPAGDDVGGNGSLGSPWATLTGAMALLQDKYIYRKTTVHVAAGSYDLAGTLDMKHPQGDKIEIVGAGSGTTFITSSALFPNDPLIKAVDNHINLSGFRIDTQHLEAYNSKVVLDDVQWGGNGGAFAKLYDNSILTLTNPVATTANKTDGFVVYESKLLITGTLTFANLVGRYIDARNAHIKVDSIACSASCGEFLKLKNSIMSAVTLGAPIIDSLGSVSVDMEDSTLACTDLYVGSVSSNAARGVQMVNSTLRVAADCLVHNTSQYNIIALDHSKLSFNGLTMLNGATGLYANKGVTITVDGSFQTSNHSAHGAHITEDSTLYADNGLSAATSCTVTGILCERHSRAFLSGSMSFSTNGTDRSPEWALNVPSYGNLSSYIVRDS